MKKENNTVDWGRVLSFLTRCPEAKQFSPMVGTCKKQKSNLMERALEYVSSSWRRSGCAGACCLSPRIVCCQMYPMDSIGDGGGGCRLPAELWQPEPISQRPRQEGEILTLHQARAVERQCAADCKAPLLNAICIQLARRHQGKPKPWPDHIWTDVSQWHRWNKCLCTCAYAWI